MRFTWTFFVCVLAAVLLHLTADRSPADTPQPIDRLAAAAQEGDDGDDSAATDDQEEQSDEEQEGDQEQDRDQEEGEEQADKDEDNEDNEDDEKQGDKEEGDQKEDGDDGDRKTHTVKTKRLRVQFESDGVFTAREMHEVELDPEAWSKFEIVEIVPHGSEVHEGQVLVKFDDEELRKEIEELELEQRINELTILKSEQELPRLEEAIKKSFEQAERALDYAMKDYEFYQETDRDIMIKSIEMSLKSAEQSAENAREELRQLEKMYEADDLTEETEEIILKRQRAAVERAEFMLERAKLSHDRNLNVYLPRQDIQEKESLERTKRAFEQAKTSLETDPLRARYELQKAKRNRTKSLERHADLTSDLEQLTLKAPAEGIVYYGASKNGQWPETANLIEKLKPESNAPTGSTLMTIVSPRPLYVVSSVDEADRPSVKEGQAATIQPTAKDSDKLAAKVSKVSRIPVAKGKFALELELEGEQPDWLVPGMSGKAKVTTYEEENAVVVPKKAVHTDEEDDQVQYVWLVEGDEVQKRQVATGKTSGDEIEILDGLDAGDVISLDDEQQDD